MQGDARDQAAAHGARTVPPREHGGNCDISRPPARRQGVFPRLCRRRWPCRWAICTSARRWRNHLLRRHREWPAGCICACP
ncbi:acetamidase/formamidase family protein [Cupriavidus basilensis]